MATFFDPVVRRTNTAGSQVHGLLNYPADEKISGQAIDIAGLISGDTDNTIKLGADGKLYSIGGGTVTCVFNIEDLISTESGNMSRPSLIDGLLFTDSCVFNTADFVSADTDNLIKFGTDGLLYVYGGDECQVNISELISADADNAITLSINDGKLYAVSSASCTYNIIDFISTDNGNEVRVGTDGKLMVENLVCTWPVVDMISSIANNRLKSHVTGDGKLYVIPGDLVSTTAPNALSTDATDFLLRVNPGDLISSDNNSGLATGDDGKLVSILGAWVENTTWVNGGEGVPGILFPGSATQRWGYIIGCRHHDADVSASMVHGIIAGAINGGSYIDLTQYGSVKGGYSGVIFPLN